MTTLHVECPTGLAGDMLLSALIDLGVPQTVVDEALAALGWADRYRLLVKEGRSGGLRGLRLTVESLEPDPPHRHWEDLRQQFELADWSPTLKRRVLAVFTALAEAEATVHGLPSDRVHFHEVGAIDSVVDVVGVCAALHHLDPDQISCDSPPVGHGSVQTAHGCLPVPVPAVLELSRRHRIPLRRGTDFPGGELTTPTGLALMAVLSDRFEAPEQVTPLAIGCGLGHRDLDRPNQLRITQLAPLQSGFGDDLRPRWQSLVVQEAWIDDASAEDVAVLVDQLRLAGAWDVASQPIQMKKGRLGQAVSALVAPESAEALRQIWFTVGVTIGLRERVQGRWLLPRRVGHLPTEWGDLPAKQVRRPDGSQTIKPELEGLGRLGVQSGLPMQALRHASDVGDFIPDGDWTW